MKLFSGYLNIVDSETHDNACRLLEERERALSEMGIHVAGSAIAVDIKKSYLVNINADPAMNEILVYVVRTERVSVVHAHTVPPGTI